MDSNVTLWSQYLWPILQFIIGLGLVIFVHELGHFLVAKKVGIKVEEFALGFGRRLWSFRRGETEYRINLLPLGGYVKMLGQDDLNPLATAEADPRSWQRAAPGKKMLVLTAGVGMNIIFAVLAFIVIYMIGIRFAAPVVGLVEPGFPADTAVLPDTAAKAMGVDKAVGLKPGDRILAINGRRVRKFDTIMAAGALSKAGQAFDFTVLRRVKSQDFVFNVRMEPKESNDPAFGKIYAFGIFPPASLTIEDAKDTPFRRGDRVVRVDGESVENTWDIEPILLAHPDEPVTITVLRVGKEVQIALKPPLLLNNGLKRSEYLLLDMAGLESRILVEDAAAGQPAAKAKLQPGDIITRYDSVDNPSRRELMAVNNEYADREVPITVDRKGKSVASVIRPTKIGERVLIGIVPYPAQEETVVAEAIAGSAAAKAGLGKGAVVTSVNGHPVNAWRDVYAQLHLNQGKPVTISYTLSGQGKTWEIPELTKELFDPSHFTLMLPVPPTLEWAGLKTEPIHGGPLQAIVWSAEDTYDWVASSYKTLRSIISGRVGPKGLAGPVGIGQMAIRTARRGPVDFAYFIAMLSTMLAFFNFLPFPVLDGGHFVLVLIEKVRGRPLPNKVIASIQIAGLVIIIGVFLLVTFNDLLRLIKLK